MPPLCVPGSSQPCACTDGSRGAQVCLPTGTFDVCVCTNEFDRIRKGMVGTWIGVHSDPWYPPFMVRIVFGVDGVYTGHCAQGMCPAPVFYWGIDDDSPVKTYQLQSLNLGDLSAAGTIQMIFSATNAQPGYFDEMFLSPDGSKLKFQFWGADRLGPVTFDLTRSQ